MTRRLILTVAMTCVAAAGAEGSAGAAPGQHRLRLERLSHPPARLGAAEWLTVTGSVVNTGHTRSGPARVSVTLERGGVSSLLGRAHVRGLSPGGTARFRVSAPLSAQPAGTWTVVACVRPRRPAGAVCRATGRLEIRPAGARTGRLPTLPPHEGKARQRPIGGVARDSTARRRRSAPTA